MSKDVKVGGGYVELRTEDSKLISGLNEAKKECEKSANKMDSLLSKVRVSVDNATMKMSFSQAEALSTKLRAKLEDKMKFGADIGSITKTKTALQQVEERLNGLKTGSQSAEGGLSSFVGTAIKGAGVFTVLAKTFTFLKDSLQTANEFEQLRTRLVSLYGDTRKAGEVFDQFNEIAQQTPYSLKQIVEAGATMKSFGMNAEETLKSVTDLASYMGMEVVESASAVGRAFAGGVGASDILRERGVLNLIKSFKGIDDLTKLTLPEFRKALIDTMQNPSAGIEGSANRMMKTWSGAVSNMGDALDRWKNKIGSVIKDALLPMVSDLTSFFSKMANVKNGIEQATESASKQLLQFDVLASVVEKLGSKVNKTAGEQELYKKSVMSLIQQYPNYFKNMDLENLSFEQKAIAISKARVELEKYLQSKIAEATYTQSADEFAGIVAEMTDVRMKMEELKITKENLSKSGKLDSKDLSQKRNETVERATAMSGVSPIKQKTVSNKEFLDSQLKELSEHYLKLNAKSDEAKKKAVETQKTIAEMFKNVIAPKTTVINGNTTTTDTTASTKEVKQNKLLYELKAKNQKEYYEIMKFEDEGYFQFMSEEYVRQGLEAINQGVDRVEVEKTVNAQIKKLVEDLDSFNDKKRKEKTEKEQKEHIERMKLIKPLKGIAQDDEKPIDKTIKNIGDEFDRAKNSNEQFASTLANGFSQGILSGRGLMEILGNISSQLGAMVIQAVLFKTIMKALDGVTGGFLSSIGIGGASSSVKNGTGEIVGTPLSATSNNLLSAPVSVQSLGVSPSTQLRSDSASVNVMSREMKAVKNSINALSMIVMSKESNTYINANLDSLKFTKESVLPAIETLLKGNIKND